MEDIILTCFSCSFPKYINSDIGINTSFTCVYEILTDPSYTSQSILFTYPLVGNFDPNIDYFEFPKPSVDAIIVQEIDTDSSFYKWLVENDVVVISNVDTRYLTLKLRDANSAQIFLYRDGIDDCDNVISVATNDRISSAQSINLHKETFDINEFDLLIIDCGIKKSIHEYIQKAGVKIKLVSCNDDIASIIKNSGVKSILISNGPGDPRDMEALINDIKPFIGKINIFGICLGHQIISLALGMEVYRMNAGHHGSNHGVLDVLSGKVIITSQNHNYAVLHNDSFKDIHISHVNVLDLTVEGIYSEEKMISSVQFHPEAAPGPHDGYYILDQWIEKIIKS